MTEGRSKSTTTGQRREQATPSKSQTTGLGECFLPGPQPQPRITGMQLLWNCIPFDFPCAPASKTASSTNTVRTFMNSGMKPWRGRVRLTWLYAEIRMVENSAVAPLANEEYLINQNWTRYEYKDSRHGRQGFPVAGTAPERLGKLGQGNAFFLAEADMEDIKNMFLKH